VGAGRLFHLPHKVRPRAPARAARAASKREAALLSRAARVRAARGERRFSSATLSRGRLPARSGTRCSRRWSASWRRTRPRCGCAACRPPGCPARAACMPCVGGCQDARRRLALPLACAQAACFTVTGRSCMTHGCNSFKYPFVQSRGGQPAQAGPLPGLLRADTQEGHVASARGAYAAA